MAQKEGIMDIERFNMIKDHYGTISKMARALGVSPQTVCNWRARDIPHDHAYWISQDTGIPMVVIRPDLERPG